jgi:hypothetical protein
MQTVISRKTVLMLKLNPLNERIKCDYARHLKAAQARAPPPSTPRSKL